MKFSVFYTATLLLLIFPTVPGIAAEPEQSKWPSLLVPEAGIEEQQPGPHQGGGMTTAFPFFAQAEGLQLVFRKRILHPGSAIGYHHQERDEIYYVVSGAGEYRLNDELHRVEAGMGLLTRAGDAHGLKPMGDEDLVIFIVYAR